MDIEAIRITPGFDSLTLLKPLARALAGEGPAVGLYTQEENPYAGQLSEEAFSHTDQTPALIIATSGSTGTPKQTVLSVEGLAASSMGTAMEVKGEGQWLLTLPVSYVAGVQVLIRSLYAGTQPIALPARSSFTPELFTAFAQELTDDFRLTSLVPTQLGRLLNDPMPATLAALQRFDAILLGGAPAPADLLEHAERLELALYRTYGSAETSGGCVYNGRPIPGALMKTVDETILLGGDTLALGYLDNQALTAAKFHTDTEGNRWYTTDDLGHISEGVLTVEGRKDDVIITGGIKVAAGAITARLLEHPAVMDAFVTPTPSAQWGQKVSAALVLNAGVDFSEHLVEELNTWIESSLGGPAKVKQWLPISALPQLPNGKTDRQKLIQLLG